MKKLIIASFIGMICFQSCTKENEIKPAKEPVDQSAVDEKTLLPSPDFIKVTNDEDVNATERKYIPQPTQTPPIYIPKYTFVKS